MMSLQEAERNPGCTDFGNNQSEVKLYCTYTYNDIFHTGPNLVIFMQLQAINVLAWEDLSKVMAPNEGVKVPMP